MKTAVLLFSILLAQLASQTTAQELMWCNEEGPLEKLTLIYGEMEVIASGPGMLYGGACWQGGYCGIADADNRSRNSFAIALDTSLKQQAQISYTGDRAHSERFAGENNGVSVLVDRDWNEKQTFRFAVAKCPDKSGKNILTQYYTRDEQQKKWQCRAVISNPCNDKDSARYFQMSGLSSFIHSRSGKATHTPKVCIYRLWAGAAPDKLQCLHQAAGNGHWGVIKGSFYLAAGDDAALDAVLKQQPASKENVLRAEKGKILAVPDSVVPPKMVEELKSLPTPAPVRSLLR